MSDDLVKQKAAIIPCIWDNDGQQYVPVYSHRGVEIADHIRKLETANFKAACIKVDDMARIEQLEAALDDMSQYVSRADWHYLKDETRAALEGKKDE